MSNAVTKAIAAITSGPNSNAKKQPMKKNTAKKNTEKKTPVTTATPATQLPVNIASPTVTPIQRTPKAFVMPDIDSLANTTVTVSIHARAFGGSKKDKTLTREMNKQAGITAGHASAVKKIMMSEELNACITLTAKIAQYCKGEMRIWGRSQYIFPAEQFTKHNEELGKMRDALRDAVNKLISKRDDIIAADRIALNGAFDISDYPSVEKLLEKAEVKIVYDRVSSGDWRTKGISAETKALLEKQANENIADIIRDGDRELLERLINGTTPAANEGRGNGLANLLYRLTHPTIEKDKDGNDIARVAFKQNSLDNIVEFAKIVRGLNISGNTAIENLCNDLEENFGTFDAEDIRDNASALEKTIENTRNAIRSIESTMDNLM